MSNLDFTVAKARGMRGKLYERERLAELCDLPSLADLAAAVAPDQAIGDAVALERRLTGDHVAALCHLLPGLGGWHAALFRWMLRRYQLENLKVFLRGWATKADPDRLAAYTVDLPGELDLPRRDLLGSASLEELIGRLAVPEFREGAMAGLGDFEESGRLFFVEAGLDQAYFVELNRRAKAARGAARRPALELVELELDIYNALLVLRAVFNYGIPFNKVRGLLAPVGRYVRMKDLDAMRRAADADGAAASLPDVLLGRPSERLTADSAETALWRRLYQRANAAFYACVLDFGAVVSFAYVKRVELRNLITVAECIRYGEPGDVIRRRLIGLPSGEPVGVR